MHTSRLGLSATKSMCLGLGVSALDRISKRPNLTSNKRSNRKFERSNLNAVQTMNNAINNNIARRQGRLF